MTPADPRLVQLERSVRRTERWTTALMVLLIVLVAGCAAFAWWQVRKVLNPEQLADRGEAFIKARYPTWKEDVQQRLIEKAPVLAQNVARRALATLPEARQEIEDYLDRQIRASLDQGPLLDAGRFRQLLHDNRDQIQAGMLVARLDPNLAKKYVNDLEKRIDDKLGARIREQASIPLGTVDRLNAKLEKLGQGKNLSATETIERRLARILRALQDEAAARARTTRGG